MKICIPIKCDNGLNSQVNDDFDSTHLYLIYDCINSAVTVIDDRNYENALGAIIADGVDSIITKTMKPAAFSVLTKRSSLTMYYAPDTICYDNIERFNKGDLLELSLEHLAGLTGCGGTCSSCSKDCPSK